MVTTPSITTVALSTPFDWITQSRFLQDLKTDRMLRKDDCHKHFSATKWYHYKAGSDRPLERCDTFQPRFMMLTERSGGVQQAGGQ